MNYRTLLKKYLKFVGEAEGSYLLGRLEDPGIPNEFSKGELIELGFIVAEIQKENQP